MTSVYHKGSELKEYGLEKGEGDSARGSVGAIEGCYAFWDDISLPNEQDLTLRSLA